MIQNPYEIMNIKKLQLVYLIPKMKKWNPIKFMEILSSVRLEPKCSQLPRTIYKTNDHNL